MTGGSQVNIIWPASSLRRIVLTQNVFICHSQFIDIANCLELLILPHIRFLENKCWVLKTFMLLIPLTSRCIFVTFHGPPLISVSPPTSLCSRGLGGGCSPQPSLVSACSGESRCSFSLPSRQVFWTFRESATEGEVTGGQACGFHWLLWIH